MVSDYVPATLPNYRPASGTNGQTYGVNAPGHGWGVQSKPLTDRELRQTWGAVGNVNVAGIVRAEESVRDLEGDAAIATYERMWKSDGQCAALMNVYLLPLLSATYSIQAASDDAEDVQIAQETSDNLLHGMVGMTWHGFLRQLFLFRGICGHAIFEKCWTVADDGSNRLRKLAPRLARTLWRWFPNDDDELDRIQQRVWVTDKDGITGQYEFPILPAQKILRSTRNQIGNNWLGTSLYRPCYKHWYYKDQLYAIDGIAAAKNAMGVPIITETASNPDLIRQAADRALATASLGAYQANERAYFYLPYGYAFDLKAVTGTVKNILPSIEHHDLLIARSFLAQFINVDSGGTLIAARDSSSFFLEALMGEAVEATDDINPLLREMEAYNHAGRSRFSTVQMQGLEQRNLEEYLRGLAYLAPARLLTPNAETENAIRDRLDLPQLPKEATPAGGGQPTVDADSQGAPALPGQDARDQQDAAGIGGTSAAPAELVRMLQFFRERDGQRAQAAQQWVSGAGRILPRSRTREGVITVPRADGSTVELTRSGGRWQPYSREPSIWSGVDLARSLAVGRWTLGSGGTSGTHCPECAELAAKGWMPVAAFKGRRPRDGSTYCTDSCTCAFEEQVPDFQKTHYAGERR
jgi:hypothetical protein